MVPLPSYLAQKHKAAEVCTWCPPLDVMKIPHHSHGKQPEVCMRISPQAVGSVVSGDLWVCRAGTVPLIQGARCRIPSTPGAELDSCVLGPLV